MIESPSFEFKVKNNHSMLREEREDFEKKMLEALSEGKDFINDIPSPIGHIYSNILEICFHKNWRDFLSLAEFIQKYNKLNSDAHGIQHTDITEESRIRIERLTPIAVILSEYDIESEKIGELIKEFLGGYDYRGLPEKIEKYFKHLKDNQS